MHKVWLWSALDRSSHQVLGWQCGERDQWTFWKLWKRVGTIRCKHYKTDYWRAYEIFLPKRKHQQTKRETHHIESYHSWLRHYLARLHRKTHCYSKKEYMLKASLLLLLYKPFLLSFMR